MLMKDSSNIKKRTVRVLKKFSMSPRFVPVKQQRVSQISEQIMMFINECWQKFCL